MSYPSILYTTGRGDVRVCDDVFEDLKISSLASDEALEVMKYPCSREEIEQRQQVFNELSDSGLTSFDTLSSLYEAISDTAEKDALYKDAQSEEIRCAVFASLMNSFCSFAIKASACDFSSVLLKRFTAGFSALTSEEGFNELFGELNEVYPLLNRIDNASFRILGESLELLAGKSESFDAKLYRCGAELGLTLNTPAKTQPRRVSAAIIAGYAKMFPDEFARLNTFALKYAPKYDRSVIDYKREIGFYISLTELMQKARSFNIPVTFPAIGESRGYEAKNVYDISLLLKNERNIVPNDVLLTDSAPFFFLTGANGGGKTTYLRAVGINLLLFLSGAPIAAQSAQIYPFSNVFTHFPRDERFENTGRFLDEEIRVKAILDNSDADSLILLNETYSTTAQELASEKTASLAQKFNSENRFGIYITHQHSIVSTGIPMLTVIIDTDDNNRRTYKISLHGASRKSFADDILKKYGLTRESLQERFGVRL